MPEQFPVDFRIAVDLSCWRRDDPPVFEVPGQGIVVGRERSRTGDDGQRQNVVVVGSALLRSAQAGLFGFQATLIGGSQPAGPFQRDQQASDLVNDRQLPAQFACGHQPRFPASP